MRTFYVLTVLCGLAAVAAAQNLPAGARSADDHHREEALNARIRAAESSLEKQNYPEAEALLRQLATERPKDSQILYDLGFAEERNGKEDDAAKAYSAAIAADASMAEPQMALGLLDARRGHLEDAHRELAAVSTMQGATPEIRGRALRTLARMDADSDTSQASAELLAAVKLTGESLADVILAAELADRSGDAADAEAAYRRALALQPQNAEVIAGLGHALKMQGKLAEADELLSRGLAEHPDDARIVAQLAAVEVAEGKGAAAIPLVEALIRKGGTDASVTHLLARLYAMNGRENDAEPIYRKLVSEQPDNPALWDALGSILVKQQKYAEAQQALTQVVSRRAAFHDDAAWGEAASHLAYAASKNKNPQLTLQALTERATVLPNSPSSLFLEATAHDSLHQRKEAVRTYKAFLAIAAGKFPDEEFEARHRLIALQNEK